MYEKHFGLTSRPFGSKAEGAKVFVGPQQSQAIKSIQKALGAPDGVVTVTGPAGAGKTTIVDRALGTLATGRTAARIGRMQMSSQEVVDLLMAGFRIKQSQQGSIRRFAAFRRLLKAQSESGIPVAIVVEDAQRLGAEALAEVEALTAADAGDDGGSANIILMGQRGLYDLLSTPDLTRLKQRIRLRHVVTPLSLAEVQGYLKHAIREAGGDYDSIFDNGVLEVVFGCSEGIPRMINTLCETALTTAMEDHSARVTVALINQVAASVFGYVSESSEVILASPVAPRQPLQPRSESPARAANVNDVDEDIDWETPPARTIDAANGMVGTANFNVAKVSEDEFGHDIIVESGCFPIVTEITAAEPLIVSAPDDEPDVIAIPDLINDTQPELPRFKLPDVDGEANIPVLKLHAGDSADDADEESDIESTRTLAQPVGLKIDEAVSQLVVSESTTAARQSTGNHSDEHFDLDAALSPEVESTNLMPGITHNIDAFASQNLEDTIIQEVVEPAPIPKPKPAEDKRPVHGDLPTLSNSMRIDVGRQVARAKRTEPDEAPQKAIPAPPSVEVPEIRAEEIEPDAAPPKVMPAPPPVEVPEIRSTKIEPDAAPPKVMPAPPSVEVPEIRSTKTAPDATPPAAKPAPSSIETPKAPAIQKPVVEVGSTNRPSNIDALEEALAAARNGEMASQTAVPAIPKVNGTAPKLPLEEAPAFVPQITLDKVIADQRAKNVDFEKFHQEISNASSLEDFSDAMAETLFGCEAFDQLAAEVVANPPEDMQLAEYESSPVKLTSDEVPHAANDASDLQLEEIPSASIQAKNPVSEDNVPLRESVSLRIDMLNAMKANAAAVTENVELGADRPVRDPSRPRGPQPEPIENQINTSITQTLEALNIAKMTESMDEEKVEKKSSRLFGLFKKSS